MADNKNLKFLSSLQFPDTAEYIIDAKYVGGFKADDLISMINSAMIFRGTLSSDSTMSPTIRELPTPTKDTIGDVYKVISDGEYNYDNNKYSIAAKNGDMFIGASKKIDSDNFEYSWVLVPAGDDLATFTPPKTDEDGSSGLVPAPTKNDIGKVLTSGGDWENPKKMVGLYTGDTEPTEDLNADDVWISSAGVKIYQITTDENNTEVRRWKDVTATSDPNNILDSDDITKLKLLLSTITLETADSNTNGNTEGTPTEGTT